MPHSKPHRRKQAKQAARLKARRPAGAERLMVLAKEIPRGQARAFVLRLRNTKWRVRKDAAYQLGKLGDQRALKALSYALRTDQSFNVRRTILASLKWLGSKESIQAIGKAMKDKEQTPEIKKSARMILEGIVEYGEDQALRKEASLALRKR